MSLELLAKIVAIVVAAVGLFVPFLGFLLFREGRRIITAVERVPPDEWFDDIQQQMKRIPSEETMGRLIRHLDRAADDNALLRVHEERIDRLEQDVADLRRIYDRRISG